MTKDKTPSVSPLVRPASPAGRPPIVAVLGHVDHGKTTLLDFIRKTSVAAKEHGGITQHIGAYQIVVSRQSSVVSQEKTFITFIDTPGHEAFAAMRSRGAKVADIALLVVAADDSVKPQTIESIRQITEAGVSMIVVINKIDLPAANLERVKADLAKHGVQAEGYGGDVPVVALSAKSGQGVSDLLDMITLVAQMKGLSTDSARSPEVVVIETKFDKRRGNLATVIVKNGTLRLRDPLYSGNLSIGKVRAMADEYGKSVEEALPSKPVEILGLTSLPPVGELLTTIAGKDVKPVAKDNGDSKEPALPDFLKPKGEAEEQKLNVVLKADAAGSLEAILASLSPRILVVSFGIGEITEADILYAKSTKSFVIGFNVGVNPAVLMLAQTEKVVCRTYTIIYKLLEELTEVVSGMKEVLGEERELGTGQIIAEFPYEGGRVCGTRILTGRLARGDTVKIMHDEAELGRCRIKSIRKGKEDTTKAEVGVECGILLDKKLDFSIGDGIIAVINV